MLAERRDAASMPILTLPGRPTPAAAFHKVRSFADILDIDRKNKDKKIKLPERYRYVPEQTGAIRATILAGLQQLPQGPVVSPEPPAAPTAAPPAASGSQPGSRRGPDPSGGAPGGGGSWRRGHRGRRQAQAEQALARSSARWLSFLAKRSIKG